MDWIGTWGDLQVRFHGGVNPDSNGNVDWNCPPDWMQFPWLTDSDSGGLDVVVTVLSDMPEDDSDWVDVGISLLDLVDRYLDLERGDSFQEEGIKRRSDCIANLEKAIAFLSNEPSRFPIRGQGQ